MTKLTQTSKCQLTSNNKTDIISIEETMKTDSMDQYTMSSNSEGMIDIEKNPIVNHQFKYNEAEILKDIQEYVSRTYRSHYTASEPGFRDIQTIDLMAAKDLASAFCQANILKYGSRYGSKDGKSKQDLMKVIHYAMLLLHFDGHYTRTNNGLNEFR
jgi:hypothetical protein